MIYIVIEDNSIQELVEEVNEWILKDFKPLGGISSDEGRHYQAMFREV